ncbi:fumarylacetoacetate hydrolase family protein [Bradyrhizobium mercantei]|uniref:fumarylacetoacetate hydrolase family protein n=1 Tax=Bradyrhizobium mercantei TaxID=1904807 RepID=UPI0009784260|nr:fumarylacetoacetate hydrolase family protein [Bradyrhizobium mercantei]
MKFEYGRLATVSVTGKTRYGAITDKGFIDLSARFDSTWPSLRNVIESDALEKLVEISGGLSEDFPMSELTFLPPVPNPEKIICVGVNYPDRNEEYKDGQAAPQNPSLFPRFPRSFVGHEAPLSRPPESPQLDYEGEIVLVIGKAGRRIAEENALDHVAAITLCNEGTIRDWVRHAKFNVTQGKNFDATGAIGPWLVPFRKEEQIADIRLVTRVNGEIRQEDRTGRMIFPFRKLINYISTFTTLVPGDLIVTGTPTGAGARLNPPRWLKPGDSIEIEAEGIGVLRNGVADERAETLQSL